MVVKKVTIIGATITDVHAGTVSSSIFETGSVSVENIAMLLLLIIW